MVDIHHHLLHGLDDGPPALEISLAMARIAAQDGITHIVCTPHASSKYEFKPAEIAARLAALRSTLAAQNIPLTLGSGCDFHLSYDNIQDAIAQPTRFAINAGPYLLVELPDVNVSPNLTQVFYDMQLAGLTLVLTHPERNATLQREASRGTSASRLAEWMRSGVLVQITAGSILGHMGKTAQAMSLQLLDNRWAHFVATDAHDTERRPPRMAEARAFIAQRCGEHYADLLCNTNPRAAFDGLPLPNQPHPRRLFAHDDGEEDISSSPPWWKRIFGLH